MPTTCDYIEDQTVEPLLVEIVRSCFAGRSTCIRSSVAWTTHPDRVRNRRLIGVPVAGVRERTKWLQT